MRGERAVEWRLVDEVVPPSAWEADGGASGRANSRPGRIGRRRRGIALTPLEREVA